MSPTGFHGSPSEPTGLPLPPRLPFAQLLSLLHNLCRSHRGRAGPRKPPVLSKPQNLSSNGMILQFEIFYCAEIYQPPLVSPERYRLCMERDCTQRSRIGANNIAVADLVSPIWEFQQTLQHPTPPQPLDASTQFYFLKGHFCL